MVEKGKVAVISFDGKDKATGKVFDTTNEKTAKDNEIYQENGVYKPFPIVVGNGEIIRGLEEELMKMNAGDEKVIEIAPEKAFGQRNPELVRIVPLKEFHMRNLQPRPGLPVELNDMRGRVQSVSGGRVRVDFNPELAGKTVEYRIKVEKIVEKKDDQAKEFFAKFFPFIENPELTIKEEEVVAELSAQNSLRAAQMKAAYSKTMMDLGFKTVKFVEIYKEADFKPKKA